RPGQLRGRARGPRPRRRRQGDGRQPRSVDGRGLTGPVEPTPQPAAGDPAGDAPPDLPFPPTSGHLIRACADRWGDRPFVSLGDERLTYADAEAASARLARGLLASGVGKGT